MLFIPGLLALTALTEARKPAVGYAAHILILVETAAVASIFVGEMLVSAGLSWTPRTRLRPPTYSRACSRDRYSPPSVRQCSRFSSGRPPSQFR